MERDLTVWGQPKTGIILENPGIVSEGGNWVPTKHYEQQKLAKDAYVQPYKPTLKTVLDDWI